MQPAARPRYQRGMAVRPLLPALLLLLLLDSIASALDVPVAGKTLLLQRKRGVERLVFVSRDPALPAPTVGGPDDPVAGSPGGALVELVADADSSVGAFALPPAPGWRVAGGAATTWRFANRAAPHGTSVVKSLVLQQGRRLVVKAPRIGLDLDGPQGGVTIRVTFGTTRICARFTGASVVRDEANAFAGRDAPAGALVDCSDATLGTSAPIAPGFYAAPWCDGDDAPMPVVPDRTKKLFRVTLHDPLAVCNDGSPAVMFVRPARPGGGHEHEWLVWLKGGGECSSPGECGDRWCGHQGPNYSARTMSSRWEPATQNAGGIFDGDDPDNRFRDLNVVQVKYCSSDEWGGSHAIDVPASASEAAPARQIPAYRITFHGHYIVEAAIAALRRGVVADVTDLAGDPVAMEPLVNATRVLWAGSSAGAAGAVTNADRVAALINTGGGHVDVQLLADAIARPYEPNPPIVPEVRVAAARAAQAANAAFRRDVLDADCVAAHPTDPGLCLQMAHVLFHHVGLRAFSQIDLQDNTVGPWLYHTFAPDPPQDLWNDFAAATRAMYQGFPALPAPGGEAVSVRDLGWFVPECRHHVTLDDHDLFEEMTLPTGTGPVSLNDVAWSWWHDGDVPRLVDDVGALTTCPSPYHRPNEP